MHVNMMRHIDYYVGIPLCFLGTIFVKLSQIFFQKKNIFPQNVLFIELSEMGSAILADPAMRKLQKKAGVRLHFAIFRKNKPSIDLLATISPENVYTIRENNFLFLMIDAIKFLYWTRRKKLTP